MAKVELKQPIVDEIKAKIDGAATVVLVLLVLYLAEITFI